MVSRFTKVCVHAFILSALATFILTISAGPAAAEYPVTTLNTLLDRAQIEDMLVDYYSQLGGGGHDFGAFYIKEGVLDVNGIIAQGQKQIEDLYKRSAQDSQMPKGAFRMLLTNLRVVVNGATATADVIWTGTISETVKATPRFVEQGREHDELVKVNGKWLFKRRVITADGGLPAMYDKTYTKR
jgi:hypothetical protein